MQITIVTLTNIAPIKLMNVTTTVGDTLGGFTGLGSTYK